MKETLLRQNTLNLQQQLLELEEKFFHARMALQKNCLHERVIAFNFGQTERPSYSARCLICGRTEEDKSSLKVFQGNPILWVKDYGDELYKFLDKEGHEYSDFLSREEIEKLGKFEVDTDRL